MNVRIISSKRAFHRNRTKAATEFFKISVFFQEQPFYSFPGGSICLSNRHVFFPGGSTCSSNRHEFSRKVYRTDLFFQEGSICLLSRPYISSNRNQFSRKLYLVLKHILFSRRPLCLEQIGIFQEATPPPPPSSNRYFVGLGGCLSFGQSS